VAEENDILTGKHERLKDVLPNILLGTSDLIALEKGRAGTTSPTGKATQILTGLRAGVEQALKEIN